MDLSASGTASRDPRNRIAGGSSTNFGEEAGWADLLYWTDDSVYVWDAKHGGGDAEAGGKIEVQQYVEALQAQLKAAGDPRTAKVGFSFPELAAPNVKKPNELVTASASEISPGVIAYERSELRGPPRPPPFPFPIPVPATQPQEQSAQKPWWKTDAAITGAVVGTAVVIGVGACIIASVGICAGVIGGGLVASAAAS